MYTFIGATLPGTVFIIYTFYVKTCMSLDNVTEKGQAENDYSTDTFDYSAYVTVCEKQSNRRFRSWFMPTIYSLICFVGLVGNLLVILTYVYFKRLKTMTDVYLLNLAGADLLFVLTLPFWAASFLDEWMLGSFLCKAMYSIYKVSFYSGMLLLTCISVDRYFAIARAISAHRHRTRAVYFSKVSSVVLWTLALLFSVPEMAYTGVNDNRTCTIINSGEKNVRMTIQISQMIAGFVLPAMVMGFCYCGIVQTLMQAQNFEKNKAIKVIFAVVAVFLLFQLPYNIAMLIATINTLISGGNDSCVFDNKLLFALDITQSLAFTRCCLNPFLYAFIGVKFRHDLFKLLKDLGCVSQERFFQYTTCSRKRSFDTKDTETTTSFSP